MYTELIVSVLLLLVILVIFNNMPCQESFADSKLTKAVSSLKKLEAEGTPAITFEHFGNAISDSKIVNILQAANEVAAGEGNLSTFQKAVGGTVSPIVFAHIMHSQRSGILTPDRVREILNTGGMQSKGLTVSSSN